MDKDNGYITDPDFWKMIRESRRDRGGIPLEKVEARITAEEKRLKEKHKRNGSKRSQ